MYSKKSIEANSNFDYRPDIDGLRAIAVISVILFHFNREWIPGGFIGVDIFFVISGFLITQLLRKELLQDNFTLGSFYARRLRRIAPALIAMLFVTVIAAFFILRPFELRSFAISLGSQVISLQNIFYLSEGEYFIGAELKPLLHTWSLAVEEQFYLLWPLMLMWMRNWNRRNIFLILFLLVIFSFVINTLSIQVSPKSSFFLLPTRAWELGIGGVSAILLERSSIRERLGKYGTLTGLVGLILLVSSFALIDSTMSFPGVAAIFPVIGTVFLIISHQGNASPLGWFLTNTLVVRIGLMSYGLYLWHWPVLAFAHYLSVDLHDFGNILAASFLITIISYFSYRYLETPVRKRILFPTTVSLVKGAVVSAAVLLLCSVHFWSSQGAAYRYDSAAQPFLTAGFDSRSDRCGFLFRVFHPRDEVCLLSKTVEETARKRVFLWGNSHADMWSGMLLNLAAANHAQLYLNAKNCRATIDSTFCNASVQSRILEYIGQDGITDVVLASSWYGAYGIDNATFERELTDAIEKLTATGANIWLVVDVPTSQILNPLSSYLLNPKAPKYGMLPVSEYQNSSKNHELEFFESIAKRFGRVKIIDVSNVFCDANYCVNGVKGKLWYRDGDHITDTGALAAKDYFLPIFR